MHAQDLVPCPTCQGAVHEPCRGYRQLRKGMHLTRWAKADLHAPEAEDGSQRPAVDLFADWRPEDAWE